MSARGDIEAGKAYIRLYMKNSELVRGLSLLQGTLRSVGNTFANSGASVAAIGATIITTAFAGILTNFAAVGGKINDIAQRTGLATNALSELAYGAELTGSSIEDLEGSFNKMNKLIGERATAARLRVKR